MHIIVTRDKRYGSWIAFDKSLKYDGTGHGGSRNEAIGHLIRQNLLDGAGLTIHSIRVEE